MHHYFRVSRSFFFIFIRTVPCIGLFSSAARNFVCDWVLLEPEPKPLLVAVSLGADLLGLVVALIGRVGKNHYSSRFLLYLYTCCVVLWFNLVRIYCDLDSEKAPKSN